MDNRLFRYILVGVIVAAVASAGYLAFQRYSIENENRQVEVAVLYDEIIKSALNSSSENDADDILQKFKEAGATGVLFKEESLKELFSKEDLLFVGGNSQIGFDSGINLLLNSKLAGTEGPEDIRPEYTYLLFADENLYKRVQEHLQLKLPSEVLHFPQAFNNVFAIGIYPQYADITGERKASLGLGFSTEKMLKVKESDLNILIQIDSWPVENAQNIKEVFSLYQEELLPVEDRLSLVAFNDSTLPGFPSELQTLAGEIADLNVTLGFVEDFIFKQEGIKNLGMTKLDDYNFSKNLAKLHAISEAEMIKFANMGIEKGQETAIDRFLLATSERNVRVLLVRLFPGFSLEDNLDYIHKLTGELERKGFTLGKAGTFSKDLTSTSARTLLVLIIGLGVISAGLLLLDILGLTHIGLGLAGLGTIGWVLIFIYALLLNPDSNSLFELAVKVMSLAAVVIFPTLAVTITLKNKAYSGLKMAIVKFIQISLISLIGAILVVGMFSHLHYILKLDQFKGVTIGLITPVLLLLLIFSLWKDKGNSLEKIKNILGQPVTVLLLLISGLFAVIGYIVVVRSGNSGIVFGLEEQFRNALQDILGIRPRTKEIIGHPLMLFLLYLGYQNRLLPLLILGTIGQVSMVNTFEHIHTPLMISLLRTFHGLWIGILGGVCLILLYKLALYLKERYIHEKAR